MRARCQVADKPKLVCAIEPRCPETYERNSFFQRCKMDDQTERSFQKQPTVFLNRKRGLGPKSRKPTRYRCNVGLGFETSARLLREPTSTRCSAPSLCTGIIFSIFASTIGSRNVIAT